MSSLCVSAVATTDLDAEGPPDAPSIPAAAPENPSRGGTYLRHPDGSLELIERTISPADTEPAS